MVEQRHGGVMAESSHIKTEVVGREVHGKPLKPQSPSPSSNKAMSPNPSQTVPSIVNRTFQYMSLGGSHSDCHTAHKYS